MTLNVNHLGLTAYNFLKSLLKWLASVKPNRAAISLMFILPCHSTALQLLVLSELPIYVPGPRYVF